MRKHERILLESGAKHLVVVPTFLGEGVSENPGDVIIDVVYDGSSVPTVSVRKVYRETGTCVVCGEAVLVLRDGTLRRHGARTDFDRATDNICSGSYSLPEEDQLEEEEMLIHQEADL